MDQDHPNSSGDVAEVLAGEDLIKIIECPICMGVPYPPIYGCINGHIICNYCRERLDRCGICGQLFREGRNIVLELIVSECKFHCNYKEAGCTAIVLGENMRKHLETCEFGPKRPAPVIVPPAPLLQWIRSSNGILPPNAVQGGVDDLGGRLYVARANHEGALTPGNYNTRTRMVHIPWGEKEHQKTEYEVLVGTQLQWIPSNEGDVPPGAFLGGRSETGEDLYIGRFPLVGYPTAGLGKVHPSHGVCYAPFKGDEKASRTYEVLVVNNQHPGPES